MPMKIAIRLATIAVVLCSLASAAGTPPPTRADRPWLGCVLVPALDWNRKNVLLVRAVVEDSPIHKAGLDDGDVIFRFNGARPETVADVTGFLDRAHAGDRVEIHFLRGDVPHIATAVLEIPTTADLDFLGRLGKSEAEDRSDDLKPVFIPRQLCLGVTFGEAFALANAPNGSLVLPLSEAESCRRPAGACELLGLVKQSATKTVVTRRGLKYSLRGDWRSVTFADRDSCLKAATAEQE